MDTFCASFSCSHSKDNSSCTCNGIASGVYAFFGCLSEFFICNDTFPLIYFPQTARTGTKDAQRQASSQQLKQISQRNMLTSSTVMAFTSGMLSLCWASRAGLAWVQISLKNNVYIEILLMLIKIYLVITMRSRLWKLLRYCL